MVASEGRRGFLQKTGKIVSDGRRGLLQMTGENYFKRGLIQVTEKGY